MSPILPAPTAAPAGPRPLRWTCDEFHRFGDMGIFEGRGACLIDGVILEAGPMNPPHALALEALDEVLRVVFGAGWRFRVQMPLVLGLHTDPLPDFAVIPGARLAGAGHPVSAALVVEVADSSLRFDTEEKRRLYAAAGIPDYWVVDVNARRLLVFRTPQGGDYADQQTFAAGDAVAPLAVPGQPVQVAALFA